jgi:hypothetical protein
MADQLLCDLDPSKTIDILDERGSFLLIRAPAGFAVVERRNGRIYPMKPDERKGVAMTAEAVSALLAEGAGCLRLKRGGSLTNWGIGGTASLGRSDESRARGARRERY